MLRLLLTSLLAVSLAVVAQADPYAARSALGRGVAALYAGESARAEQAFGEAIALAPADPSGYYYRAVALQRLDRSAEAQQVAQMGARIETETMYPTATVDRALRSLAAADRLLVEQYREAAHVGVDPNRRAANRARQQALEAQQALVQRKAGRLPLAALASSLSLEQARLVAADPSDPFVDDEPVASAMDRATPGAEELAPPTDDPFAATTDPNVRDDSTAGDASPPPLPPGVDVPEAARGSVSTANLFGRMREAITNRAAGITNQVQSLTGGVGMGGPPGMGPPGMVPPGGEFGPPAGPPGDDPFAAPAATGDDPFAAPADANADPFAAPAETPAETAPDGAGGDPFAPADPAMEDAGAADNPFGE